MVDISGLLLSRQLLASTCSHGGSNNENECLACLYIAFGLNTVCQAMWA